MRCALLFVVTGCVAGTIEGTGGGGGGTSNPSVDGGPQHVDAPAAPMIDAPGTTFTCRNKVLAVGTGHHNEGQDCMQGCHNHGFTLSGTIYAGTVVLSGASITVKDAANQTFDMVSQANGNFYTLNPITFPVTVIASMCPDIKPMVSQVAAGSGGCNKTGCHQSGAQGPIHLP